MAGSQVLKLKLPYLLPALLLCFSTAVQSAEDNAIGYESIQAAYEALEADPEAVLTEYGGWEIFNQKADGSYFLWSFTPDEHPAHPSVVKRQIVSKDKQIHIKMDALCYASKIDCDQLIEQFKQINERIKNSARED